MLKDAALWLVKAIFQGLCPRRRREEQVLEEALDELLDYYDGAPCSGGAPLQGDDAERPLRLWPRGSRLRELRVRNQQPDELAVLQGHV